MTIATPPAVLAPSVALERLERGMRALHQFVSERSRGPAPYYKPSGMEWDQLSQATNMLAELTDELAALRTSLAQQGEAVAELENFRDTDGGITTSLRLTPTAAMFDLPLGKYPLFTHPAAVDAVRTAVADYMHSEGCACCRDIEAHDKHAARLAALLNVEPYADGSGYNFSPYRTAALLPATSEGENNDRNA